MAHPGWWPSMVHGTLASWQGCKRAHLMRVVRPPLAGSNTSLNRLRLQTDLCLPSGHGRKATRSPYNSLMLLLLTVRLEHTFTVHNALNPNLFEGPSTYWIYKRATGVRMSVQQDTDGVLTDSRQHRWWSFCNFGHNFAVFWGGRFVGNRSKPGEQWLIGNPCLDQLLLSLECEIDISCKLLVPLTGHGM